MYFLKCFEREYTRASHPCQVNHREIKYKYGVSLQMFCIILYNDLHPLKPPFCNHTQTTIPVDPSQQGGVLLERVNVKKAVKVYSKNNNSVLFSAKGIFKFEILLLVNLAIESKLLTSIFAANFSMSHLTLLDDFNAKKSWWPFLKLDLSVLYFSGNFI